MLFKNVLKTLGKKWLQLIAIGIIIILSSMIFTMMFYGVSGIEGPTEDYLDDYRQEDFSVDMVQVISPDEDLPAGISELAAEGIYTLSGIKEESPELFDELLDTRAAAIQDAFPRAELELRPTKTAEETIAGELRKTLVLKDAGAINQTYVEEGRMPELDDEIGIARIYAEKNGLQLGDRLTVQGKDYTITGFVLFPDYTLLMFENMLNIDPGLQTTVLMTDSAYESFSAQETFRYAGAVEGGDTIDTTFDRENLPFVTQVLDTANNMRSGGIYLELSSSKTTALGLSIFIAAIAVIIVSIMIYNILQAERGQIGILKALGYSRRQIASPYLLSIMVMAFIMLAAGYVFGLFLAEPLRDLYLEFYLLPSVEISQQLIVFAIAIVVPFAFFTAVSGLIISKILSDGPLVLLHPPQNSSVNRLTRLVGRLLKNANAQTKFKYLQAVKSTGSFLIFFTGIMFSTILIIFALMMSGMVDRLTVDVYEQSDFQYQAFINPEDEPTELRDEDDIFLQYPYAQLGGEAVTLHGIETDNRLYHLFDASGIELTSLLDEGAVITRSLSIKQNISAGDRISVQLIQDDIELTVQAVADEYASDTIYVDIEKLSLLLTDGERADLYTGIYALEEPDDEAYAAVISKQSMIDTAQSIDGFISLVTTIMIVGAGVISGSILFVLTSFTVEKNYYTISLLKVMGYSRREVNSMVLNSYFVYAVLSYLVSLPIAILSMDVMMTFFAEEYGVIIPLDFQLSYVIWSFLMIIIFFFASTWISRRKIAKVPLQEVLKTYQE
ncbi:ABC transporter permease [Salipaludibacillus aurantiacus]|uniref:Putative ABC transport system permease protein n=1 Tax=Salipaludibacillus aurantiacus TaxID=1601833 RepID=A0A1H9W482_9BACI|nr:ABC transporter permease [Salipaludibacillus aurantiacus]SES28561.1 putative ABC transport system permease protein [Salipaludibacillus aurantiacus]